MKKRVFNSLFAMVLAGVMLSGCGATDISEVIQDNVEVENVIVGSEEEIVLVEDPTVQQPWLMYDYTENINTDMEKITAWDVVDDIRVGWNLGNSLESTSNSLIRIDRPWKWETAWHNPVTTEEMIEQVIAAGFDCIRVPVTWGEHMDEQYMIVEAWMDRVQEVVDYAYSRGVYVILNSHHEDWNYPYYDNQQQAVIIEKKIWAQIAERFKDYDEHLIFEAQNEPRKVGTSLEWTGGDTEGQDVVNAINAACVEAVRNSGGSNPYRMIMLPTYAASSTTSAIENWKLPEGESDRIIVSVHAYIPYNFALNTNSPASTRWNNDTGAIDTLMKDIKANYTDKNIPTIIGEMGAILRTDEEETRLEWVDYYLNAANEIRVTCCWWDNNAFSLVGGESLGLFNRNTLTWDAPELLEQIMDSTEPRAKEGAVRFNYEEYINSQSEEITQ